MYSDMLFCSTLLHRVIISLDLYLYDVLLTNHWLIAWMSICIGFAQWFDVSC